VKCGNFIFGETGFDGGCAHFLGWFGVGRFQWRRGERKIFLHPTQELSVKSFYAPFLRLNVLFVYRSGGKCRAAL
jgi:hypothetical protein